jgi:hypothetical protein
MYNRQQENFIDNIWTLTILMHFVIYDCITYEIVNWVPFIIEHLKMAPKSRNM